MLWVFMKWRQIEQLNDLEVWLMFGVPTKCGSLPTVKRLLEELTVFPCTLKTTVGGLPHGQLNMRVKSKYQQNTSRKFNKQVMKVGRHKRCLFTQR
jgi:hypothetical protein